jgi:hypothetical protein
LQREREQNLMTFHKNLAARERPGEPPRWDVSGGEQLLRYFSYIPDARQTRLVILTGMSQLMGVNNEKPGDKIVSELLDDALIPAGVRVYGIPAANMSNEEALFQLVALLADPRTIPAVFIYGVCFDKYRNVDLRPGFLDFLRARKDVQARWAALADRMATRYPQAREKMQATLEIARAEAQQKDDSTFESKLRSRASSYVPLVEARKDFNAQIQLGLYRVRNWVFDIKTSTKRPIIQSRYDLNVEFQGLIADLAAESGVNIILYINPLNPRGENPYVPEQYAAFKEWATQFAADRKIPFANIENIVPEGDWGEFMGGPDFKHFRGEGHRLTANAILERFGDVLRPSAAH